MFFVWVFPGEMQSIGKEQNITDIGQVFIAVVDKIQSLGFTVQYTVTNVHFQGRMLFVYDNMRDFSLPVRNSTRKKQRREYASRFPDNVITDNQQRLISNSGLVLAKYAGKS